MVSYTTDIPAFGTRVGQAFFVRAGEHSLRAHRREERVPKSELLEAVQIYQNIVRQLKAKMSERIPGWGFRRDGNGGAGVCELSPGPSVVRSDVAGGERPLGGEAVSRGDSLETGRRDACRTCAILSCRIRCRKGAPKLVFSAMDASVATEIEQAFAKGGALDCVEFAKSPDGCGCAAAGAGGQRGSPEAAD